MKDVYKSFIKIKNPTLPNYYKRIYLSQICFLSIEMLKFKRRLTPALIKEMIPQNRQNKFKLQNNNDFTLPLVQSFHRGLKSCNY